MALRPSHFPMAARSGQRWTATACAPPAIWLPATTWSSWRPKPACCQSPKRKSSRNGGCGPGSSAMGNGSRLAVVANKNKPLYNYFKQLFAQVTNPPIDPIREDLVMSLVSFIGPKPNLLSIDETNPPMRLEVGQPVLDFNQMDTIRHIDYYTGGKFKSFEIDITYPVAWGQQAIEARLASLCAQAEDAVRSGYNILIVSDRKVDADHVAIPALLALSGIHQHLVGKGLRTSAGLVVETGSAREVHHFALLAGYGAGAID